MSKQACRLAFAAILALTWPAVLEAAEMSAVQATEEQVTAQPAASATPA